MSKTLTESLGKISRISQFFSLIMCNCIWQSGFEEIIKLSVVWCCTYYLRPIASIFKNNPTLKTQRTRGLGIYAFLKVLVSKFLLLNISNNRRVWEKNNWYPFTHNPHLLFFKKKCNHSAWPLHSHKGHLHPGPQWRGQVWITALETRQNVADITWFIIHS